MGKSLKDMIAAQPTDEQKRIKERTRELIAEVEQLQEVRQILGLTQAQLSEQMQIKQQNISKLEKRADLKLSTLRHYIESMGGELDIVAHFPDNKTISLSRVGQD